MSNKTETANAKPKTPEHPPYKGMFCILVSLPCSTKNKKNSPQNTKIVGVIF